MKKTSRKLPPREKPLQQPPPEHFQPIEKEDPGEDDPAGADREEFAQEQIPPLRHPYPPFWEERSAD